MKVIKPVVINESTLISSSVPETEYPAYDPAASYAVGTSVVYKHVVYESVEAPNTGNVPDRMPRYWAPKGPTNRWLMFDDEVNSVTETQDDIDVLLAPGIVNSLALLELYGTEVDITVTDGIDGPVLYNRAQSLEGSVVTDWYQYFFEPFEPVRELILTDLPPYVSARVHVKIKGGPVRVGSLIVGTAYFIGDLEHGAQVGIIDYSRKVTSDNGDTKLDKRRYSKRLTGQVWLENGQLSRVYRTLADLRATACVWIGADEAGYEVLSLFGFYRDFALEVAYPTKSYCSLEIEGLV